MGSPPRESAELYARAAGAGWALFARPRWTLADEDEALAPLSEEERLIALALVGPAASGANGPGTAHASGGIDGAIQRLTALGLSASVIDAALAGRGRDGPSLDRAWLDLEAGRGDRRLVVAVALALTGVLPLSLERADQVMRLPDPLVAAVVALAVGVAARRGDPSARAIARDIVTLGAASGGLDHAVLKGLGRGLLRAGATQLIHWARGAILDRELWGIAARRTTVLLARQFDPGRADLVSLIADGVAVGVDRDSAGALVDELVACGAGSALAAYPLEHWPAPVRAALAARWCRRAGALSETEAQGPAEALPLPHAFLAHLPRERAPDVIGHVLERCGEDPLWAQEAGQALFRAWADHPDVEVRKALAQRAAGRSAPAGAADADGAAAEAGPVAEVVALPPSILARDELDRLRVALWSGDSEHVIELSTCVPLDRRVAAREALLGAIEVPNAALRRAIVEAVGRIGSQADGPRLIDAARRYRALEGTVATALRELGARGLAEGLAEVFKRRLKWADDDAVDDYCAIAGSEQIQYLLAALETRYYPSARAGAARAIARLGAHEVVFALRTLGLSDTQDAPRLAALAALHALTGTAPSAGEMAGHALLFRPTDELPDTIERAKEAGAQTLPGIRRTMARGSWKRRRAACEVLATVPGDEAVLCLLEALEDADEDVRFAAMDALAVRGWHPATPRERTLIALAARRPRELLEATADADGATLVGALRLGGHVFRAEVLEVLERLPTFEPDEAARAPIAVARLDIGAALAAPGGVEATLRGLDHTWQATPHRARFVRGLCEVDAVLLEDAARETHWSWRAREGICQALARPGDDAGVAALARELLQDDDDVRKAALQALAWIGTEAAAEGASQGLASPFQEDRDLVARALATFGKVALPLLERLARDPWWEVRQGAAQTYALWVCDVGTAVDRLLALAVDSEYRVAHAAREGLAKHGLLPSREAVCEAIGGAQTLTIEGLEPWLGLSRADAAVPEVAGRFEHVIEETPPDHLPQRLGLIATMRVEHLALWLEEAALGLSTRHIGVRLAAADALRALIRRACPVCRGERSVRCPGCDGSGDRPCPRCEGSGAVLTRCPEPECTALQAPRRIDSRRCPTCRGRGEIATTCACQVAGPKGRVPCDLCGARGRLPCVACDATGAARAAGFGAEGRSPTA